MPNRKIMLIRHAEKPDDAGNMLGVDRRGARDPQSLSVTGWERAGALVRFFAPLDARFPDPRIETPQGICAAAPLGRSLRPIQTVDPLASLLGLPMDTRFGNVDDVPQLVDALRAGASPALVSWRHDSIATIARSLLPAGTQVPDWPDDRFDLVWVLSPQADGWSFGQVPQLLLPGDRADLA